MAALVFFAIAFALCSILALSKSIKRPKNLLLMLGYLASGFVCYLVFWGFLHLAGWIGDRTDYAGQTGIIIGAIWPGLSAIRAIPKFISVAIRQTSGIHVT